MATVSNHQFSFRSSLTGLHKKFFNFAKKLVQPSRLWTVETVGVSIGTISSAIGLCMAASYNPATSPAAGLIHGAILFSCAVVSPFLYKQFVSVPFIQQEMQLAVQNSKKNRLSMLVIRAKENQLKREFTSYSDLEHLQNASKKYSIDVMEAGSEMEWRSAMASNQKQYDRIDLIVHSNNEELQLSHDFDLNADSKDLLQWFNRHIKKEGILSLNCCSAAEGVDNVAKTLSRACPHAVVRASQQDINQDQIVYNRDGFPTYWKGIKDITRRYRNGVLIRHKKIAKKTILQNS